MEKSRKKNGFTLVELLAVIVILAIVVGISIPGILNTITRTKQKAFETTADITARWFDDQYRLIFLGDQSELDEEFKKLCIRECINSSCDGQAISSFSLTLNREKNRQDLNYNSQDDDACNCGCDKRLTYLTSEIITASGIKKGNVQTIDDLSRLSDSYVNNGLRVHQFSDDYYLIKGSNVASSENKYALLENEIKYSRVFINPDTGRSCVTLHSISDRSGKYPPDKVVCGGVCQNSDKTKPDYCQES